ncbi:MAG: LysR family transcriptional regulator [Nibricoccus sp.]
MEWLNYHHLRYFWCVAREGSLLAAAKKLNVSPPSISAQIRGLEEMLDVKLFRRDGRANVLTDAGQLILRYADEIFLLGRDMVSALKQRPTVQAYRLQVGVCDSLPKLVAQAILEPAILLPSVQLVCREGKLDELLVQLALHRLDIVLADEPAGSSAKARVFNHLLGESRVIFCAEPQLAKKLKRGFPGSLDGAPALLPADQMPLRRLVENWFRSKQVVPKLRAECEDLALLKVMASRRGGFVALPEAVKEEAQLRYGLVPIGVAQNCHEQFYAITAERKITHPTISLLTSQAQKLVFR